MSLGGWRRCNESLPESIDDVLIFSKMGGKDIGSWDGKGWYLADGMFIVGVTHWIPLPEEPE